MSTRSVIVRLEAEVAGFVAGMGQAGRATDNVARQVVQSRRAVEQNREAMEKAGKTLMAFGTVGVAALGAATKAAMDWETAWAGVTKTVDGTPAQMDELEASLRGLAKTLPATHEEIAGVAEAAGQLGVAREDILSFTKTMVDLGETTNLTAEEAATSIAQIANVMGTVGDDIDNFGATLVALGNAGASTEKDILEMTKRLAGAGKLVGASEGEVMALANAMASVGIEAQLGGGVMSRVMQRMYADVKTGGEGLDNLAKTAGVSSKEFAAAFENDPIRAVDMLTKGLGRIKDEGGNVVEAMKELGIKGTEETGVILRLVGAGDLLGASLKLQEQAWRENTALINEATKRYETTESKVKVAWNGIKDAAIDAGAVMLPVIQGVAESVSGLASTFGGLPKPVQGAVTVFAGVVGGAALVGGGLLTLIPKVAETREAFRTLRESGSRVPGVLGKIGKAAGLATVAIAGFEIVKGLANSMQPGTQSVEKFTQGLVGLSREAGSLDQVFKDIEFGDGDKLAGEINSAGDAMARLVNQDFSGAMASFGSTVLGFDNGMTKLADGVAKADQAIAGAANSGNMETAAAGFKSVAESAAEQGVSIEKTAERFPLYLDALRSLASESKVALTEQELLAWAMGEVPPAMEAAAAGGDKAAQALIGTGDAAAGAAAKSAEIEEALAEVGVAADGTVADLAKFTEALFNAGLLQLSARDAARGFEEALDAVGASAKTNGKSMDITTEKGRANEAALDAVAAAGYKVIQADAENGAGQEVLQGKLAGTYQALIDSAGQFGITGDAAIALAREILKVPEGVTVESWMSDAAKRMAQDTKGAMDAIDGKTVHTYSIQHKITRISTEVAGGGSAEDPSMTALDPGNHATGGAIYGPGGPTSDDVPAWLSNGEHVLTAREVQEMGGQQAVYRFRSQVRAGQAPAFASGGAVGTLGDARQFMVASTAAPAVSLEGLTVMVTNPFTGAQVRGLVSTVAQHEAGAVLSQADGNSRFKRKGRA